MERTKKYAPQDKALLRDIAGIQPDLNWRIRNEKMTETDKKVVIRLDGVIEKNRTTEDIIVFRAIADETWKAMKRTYCGENLILTDPAYLSCSRTHQAIIESFPYNRILILAVHAGTAAAPIELFSESPWQQEVLLGRDRSMRVLSEHQSNGRTYIWAELW